MPEPGKPGTRMSVLRTLVVLVALAIMASGGRLLMEGLRAPGFYLLGVGALIFAGTLFERWRYRATLSQAPQAWQRTGERFVDPESGRTLSVFYDPVSGERHYVNEQPDADRSRGPEGS
jgi:hypothetical protein